MKNLKNTFVVLALSFVPFAASAQFFLNSALNLSEIKQSGTARFQAVGGNHAALGGDASTVFGNPAGLAFYNRSEMSISPTLFNNNTTTNFIGTNTADKKNNFNIGHVGFVFAGDPQGPRSNLRRTTFAVTYSRNNNLSNQFRYTGQNNASSFIDWGVQSVGNVAFDVLESEYDPRKNMSQSIESAMFHLYLFDDTTPDGPPYRKAIPLKGSAAVQDGVYQTTGSTGQWTFAYSANFKDKFYVGGSVAIWKGNYEYQHNLKERYTNAAPFLGIDYNENLVLTSTGMNASAGFIYKPTSLLQIGGYITTPTASSVRTTFNEEIGVDLSGDVPQYNPAGQPIKNAQGQQQYAKLSQTSISVEQYDFGYELTTPLRAAGGATFFVGKKGFITATAEYVGYKGIRFNTDYFNNSADNQDFKDNYKSKVLNAFNNVVNVRVGGEGRLGNIRVRAGGAYLPDPYRTTLDALNRSRFQYSGGLGYRNEQFFVDGALTFMQSKDAYTPYTMADARRTPSASVSNNGLNFMVTAGVLF